MANTKIQWCDSVWNPTTGCSKVSEGCRNCYAERLWPRLKAMGNAAYRDRNFNDVACHPERLEQPLEWKKPRRIFVNSMSDLFHEDVPFEFVDRVMNAAYTAKQHVYLVLTKRPERMKLYFESCRERGLPVVFWMQHGLNLWLGVSVENQATADERIPLLLQTPAVVRFISAEPLLGPINLTRLCDDKAYTIDSINGIMRSNDPISLNPESPLQMNKLDWVITGGESGPKARPAHPDWVRSLRDQCQAANIPFFFKQWGEFAQCDYEGKDYGARYIDSQCIDGELWDLDKCDEKGNLYSTGDNLICPKCKGLGYIRVGKKKAGRILDGRT